MFGMDEGEITVGHVSLRVVAQKDSALIKCGTQRRTGLIIW
jgi:hypothetical protein